MAENQDKAPVAENVGSADNMKKIVDQLEYYFGDYNLPRDKFLRQQTELDDGWIPLDIMLKFQRLAKLSNNEPEAIIKAVEELKSSLLELSEDKKKIRRDPAKPVPVADEERQLEIMSRTIYCKGFNVEESLDNIREFFLKHGSIVSVHMRSYKDKKATPPKSVFKGSVFVVFEKLDEAEAFMKLETISFNDTELIRKWQKDYNEEKRLERLEKLGKGKRKNRDKDDGEEDEEPMSIPTGCYMHLAGPFAETTTREELRAAIQENCDVKVAFVQFNKGEKEAWVRLQGENTAAKAVEKVDGKLILTEDLEVVIRTLSEEEEKPHREQALQHIANSKNKKGGGGGFRRGGKRRGGGRGGRHHGGKRARNDGD